MFQSLLNVDLMCLLLAAGVAGCRGGAAEVEHCWPHRRSQPTEPAPRRGVCPAAQRARNQRVRPLQGRTLPQRDTGCCLPHSGQCRSHCHVCCLQWSPLSSCSSVRCSKSSCLLRCFWHFTFLLTVTPLDSRGSLSEAGVCSSSHPGALGSAGDAEEIPPAGVWTVQLREQCDRSDLIVTTAAGRRDSEPCLKTHLICFLTNEFNSDSLQFTGKRQSFTYSLTVQQNFLRLRIKTFRNVRNAWTRPSSCFNRYNTIKTLHSIQASCACCVWAAVAPQEKDICSALYSSWVTILRFPFRFYRSSEGQMRIFFLSV